MVFVHLLGSHVIYENRFPPERALFDSEDILSTLDRPWLNNDGAQLLADYSNSLVFTDSIWHEIAMEQENLDLQKKQKEICDKSIANLQKEISQRTGEIAVYDEILQQKTRFALQEIEELISEKESFIANLQEKIDEREFAINDLSQQQNNLSEILSQITEIQSKKAALSQEIEIQKTQISQVLKNLSAEKITLETISASKSVLEKNIANSQKEKNALQNEIDEFHKNEKDCDKKIHSTNKSN